MRSILMMACAFAPTLTLADTYVTDSALCGQEIFDVVDAGGVHVTATEMNAAELYCTWNDPIALDLAVEGSQTTIGFCDTSDMTFPTVFTFRVSLGLEGELRMYQSDGTGTATVLFTCAG